MIIRITFALLISVTFS